MYAPIYLLYTKYLYPVLVLRLLGCQQIGRSWVPRKIAGGDCEKNWQLVIMISIPKR